MRSRLALALEAAWYRPPRLLWVLLPLEWLYAAVISLRAALYRKGWLASSHPGVPVVVVGNISVGGTGKTPVVIALCKELEQLGHKVAVISRGYGGSARGVMRVEPDADAALVGDESLLIARATGLPVYVGRDRAAAATSAAQDGCGVIVSDDGLQHYALQRDIEVVCLDAQQVFGNGHQLPVGPLREPPRRLATVDFVLHRNGQDVFSGTRYQPREFRSLDGSSRCDASAAEIGPQVHAIAAIARPERYFDTLEGLGLEVNAHPLRDHETIDTSLLESLDAAPVVITSKDAVKLPATISAEVWVLEMGLEFPEGFVARMNEQITKARERYL